MPEIRTDEQLVAAYLSCEKLAFDEIFNRHNERLFIFAWGKLRHYQDAQDAVQETWFKTWQSLTQFDDTHKFSSWLYKICQNFCYMKMRERGRNRFTAFADLPDKIEKLKPGPIKEVAESMEVRFRILAVLNHEEHKIWELVVTKGWTYEAIAQDEKLFRGKSEEELRQIFGTAWRKVWEQRNKEVAKWKK